MRTIVKTHRRVTSSKGVVTDEPAKFWLRAVGGTCTEDQIGFGALTDDAKLALTATMPTPASGKRFIVRDCAEASLTIILSNNDFVADSTTPPPTGSGDLIVPYLFTGTPSGGYRSTEPDLLLMAFDFINGRIRNLRNNSTRTIPDGKIVRYLINNRWYAYTAGQWYRVFDNASVASVATNLSFSPQLGVLIQYYEVAASRPMSGWRDNPVTPGSQLIRVL